jgi:hypothetical protein
LDYVTHGEIFRYEGNPDIDQENPPILGGGRLKNTKNTGNKGNELSFEINGREGGSTAFWKRENGFP